MIGSKHDILIVFNDQYTVTDISEVLKRCDQPVVVSLVQADAGFIQDIGDALQLRAYLRGQSDAL
jgi:hypothetical protein